MKTHIYTLFLVLLCTGTAASQNWQLLSTDKPLFFRKADGKNIGFEVISMNKRGLDRIYELSASAPDQEDISGMRWTTEGGSSTLIGRILVVKSNGNTWLKDSADGDSLLIKPLATTGNKWTFNKRKKITASVISIFTAEINGLKDSVKLIQLSNNLQIVLSKNNGLWSTPNFYPNNANEVNTYGRTEDRRLTFRMVNNFDVGDIFHKVTSRGFSACSTNYIDTVVSKIVSTDGNTVTYTMQRVKEVVCEPTGPDPGTQRTVTRKTVTREFNYRDELVFKALPNTLFLKPDSGFTDDPDSIIVYSLGDAASRYNVPYMETSVSYSWNSDERLYIFGAGSYYFISLESEKDPYYSLPLYFKKDTVEWGKQLVIGLPENATTPSLKVFPNPVHDRLSISGLREPVKARVLDITGRVHQTLLLDNGSLPVHSLPPGPYVLALEDGRRISFSVL